VTKDCGLGLQRGLGVFGHMELLTYKAAARRLRSAMRIGADNKEKQRRVRI